MSRKHLELLKAHIATIICKPGRKGNEILEIKKAAHYYYQHQETNDGKGEIYTHCQIDNKEPIKRLKNSYITNYRSNSTEKNSLL